MMKFKKMRHPPTKTKSHRNQKTIRSPSLRLYIMVKSKSPTEIRKQFRILETKGLRYLYSAYGLTASTFIAIPKWMIMMVKNRLKTFRSAMHWIIMVVITENLWMILKKKNSLNNMKMMMKTIEIWHTIPLGGKNICRRIFEYPRTMWSISM